MIPLGVCWQDEHKLKAEHLKLGGATLINFLSKLFNKIITDRKIPKSLKTAILHPIHKPGNPTDDPGNYRGISITPIIARVLDAILVNQQRAEIPEARTDLQLGFTAKRSPVHATILLSEALAEAQDNKVPIYTATLDIQKAFDVVPHASLLRKLFDAGLKGPWWTLKKDS